MFNEAAAAENLDLMAWLHSQGCLWSPSTTDVAFRNRGMRAFQWLRTQTPPSPWFGPPGMTCLSQSDHRAHVEATRCLAGLAEEGRFALPDTSPTMRGPNADNDLALALDSKVSLTGHAIPSQELQCSEPAPQAANLVPTQRPGGSLMQLRAMRLQPRHPTLSRPVTRTPQ